MISTALKDGLSAADRERLSKILGMTGSAHDGEALAALRAANELLARHRVTWADVVMPSPATLRVVAPASSYPPGYRPPTGPVTDVQAKTQRIFAERIAVLGLDDTKFVLRMSSKVRRGTAIKPAEADRVVGLYARLFA